MNEAAVASFSASGRVYHAPRFEECLERLGELHPRLCPRQVLGVRIGLQAGPLLGMDVPQPDKRLLTLVETDGCFADGVSVATGCWLGRRTLRLLDYGNVAATFVDLREGRAIRVRPSLDQQTSGGSIRRVIVQPTGLTRVDRFRRVPGIRQ